MPRTKEQIDTSIRFHEEECEQMRKNIAVMEEALPKQKENLLFFESFIRLLKTERDGEQYDVRRLPNEL